MTASTPLLRRSAAAVFAGALLLTACGSSGGSDAKSDKTTTTAAKATTTTKAEATTTTTTAASGDGPTTDELKTVFPTADDFGTGWTIDDSEQGPDTAIETATQEQCPDAAGVLARPDDDEVTQAYTGPAGESVRITLASGVTAIDPAAAQTVIDSINDCDAVTAKDGGVTYTASFDASLNDSYADGGVQIAVSVNITDGTDSTDVKLYRVIFSAGTVGVTITGSDGVADDGTVTAIDTDGLDAVAKEMATRAGSL